MRGIYIGLLFHIAGYLLIEYYDDSILGIAFGFAGAIYVFSSFLFSMKNKPFSGIKYNIFLIFLLLTLVMIIRGYLIDYPFIWISQRGMLKYHLFDSYYLLPYLIPFFLFLKIDWLASFRVLLRVSEALIFLFFLFLIVNLDNLLKEIVAMRVGLPLDNVRVYTMANYLASNFTFLLLLRNFVPKRTFRLAFLAVILMLLFSVAAGRRGGVLMFSLLVIITLYKDLPGTISRLMLIACLALALFPLLETKLFSFLIDRGFEDNRSGVDIALMDSLSSWQVWFGKGLNGRYFYPIVHNDYLKGWRYVSETGFYNFILKGGYLYTGLYLFFLLLSSFKGLFCDKNSFVFGTSVYIFLSVIELYPFGLPHFGLKYFFIWYGVKLILNKKNDFMTDNDIYAKMNNHRI